MVKISSYKCRFKWQFVSIGLIFLLFLTNGCVYFRFLKAKRQLSEFNTYFQIKEEKGLTLVFLKPVLLSGDIVWLMKSIPTSKEKTEKGELWQYLLKKQYAGPKNEEGNFDISISMLFEDDKLRQISFPERFLKYISKPLLIKMMKSVGDAEIDKSERRAGSRFQARSSLEIPRKQQLVEVLGLPFSAKDSNNTSAFIYKYNLSDQKTGATSAEFSLVMGFNIQKEDNRVLQAETNLNGLRMSLDFSLNKK